MRHDNFNYAKDTFVDYAVIPNTDTMATKMGYASVAEVRTTHMTVMVGVDDTFAEDIGKNKYRSAVFVEFFTENSGTKQGHIDEVVITEQLQQDLRLTMGETVCNDALRTKGVKHAFAYAVLSAPTDGTASIYSRRTGLKRV